MVRVQKDAHSLILGCPAGLDWAPSLKGTGGPLGVGRVERGGGGAEWKLISPTSTQLDIAVGSADGKSVVL